MPLIFFTCGGSNGVIKELVPFQPGVWLFQLSSTPILQNSSLSSPARPVSLTIILSQSAHSTHKPSSLMQSSQYIRRQILHSWTARTSSFSTGSPHAEQAKSSAITTPPFVRYLAISKIGMDSHAVNVWQLTQSRLCFQISFNRTFPKNQWIILLNCV